KCLFPVPTWFWTRQPCRGRLLRQRKHYDRCRTRTWIRDVACRWRHDRLRGCMAKAAPGRRHTWRLIDSDLALHLAHFNARVMRAFFIVGSRLWCRRLAFLLVRSGVGCTTIALTPS